MMAFGLDAPDVDRPLGRPAIVLGALFAVALLCGLLEAAQAYLRADLQHRPYTWALALLDSVPTWLLLAALAPAVIAMARYVRLDRVPRGRAVAAHVFGGAAFAVLHQVCAATFVAWRYSDGRFTPLVWKFLTLYFAVDFLIYWAIVGACYAFEYARELRRRELAASQLQASLSQARLQALRAQLNPHFLFNTLNAISVQAMKGEGEHVVRTLSLLSDLLRLSLDGSLPQEIPLVRELDLTERYLKIQLVRFPDRLRVEQDIHPAALEALVPSLILQPVVENAVMHGVSLHRGAGTIRISARPDGSRLTLRVHDTGPGFILDRAQDGIGLGNTRARLEHMYGGAHAFSYGNDGDGAWVAIELPYRRAQEAGAWTG